MNHITTENARQQFPALLQKIDQDLVNLESQRQSTSLLERLTLQVENLLDLSKPQYPRLATLSQEVALVLQGVQGGRVMLSAPVFESLFNAVPLMQEQIEATLSQGREVENSQLLPLVNQLQAFSGARPAPGIPRLTEASSPPPSVPPAVTQPVIAAPKPESFFQVSRQANELLALMKELEEVTYAGDVDAIRDHLKGCITLCESLHTTANPARKDGEADSMKAIVEELRMMVQQWAAMHGKQVQLQHRGEDIHLPQSLLRALRKALLQFAEFLIEESLEAPSQRRSKGAEGHLYLEIMSEEGHLLITLSDDGRGLKPDSLKQRASELRVLPESKLRQLSDREALALVFHQGMYSVEDAEAGAQFPELQTEILALDGTIGLESSQDMFAFVLTFPLKKESSFMNAVSAITASDLPQNLSLDLASIRDSAGAIQSIMEGLHGHLSAQEMSNLEQHLTHIFSGLRTLVAGLSHGDLQSAREATKTLSEIANVDLFKEVGMMAREMHENLKEFSSMLGNQFQGFDMDQIPDAAHRLAHIIEMTENSANTTLDLSESLMIDSGETQADLDAMKEMLTNIHQATQHRGLAECLQLIDSMKQRELQVNEKIVGIMTAQDYQDRTGQVIKKIITLVNDLEKRLVSLVQTFGTSFSEIMNSAEEKAPSPPENEDDVQMYGPQHGKGKGMTNQDDVDSLLAQFGF